MGYKLSPRWTVTRNPKRRGSEFAVIPAPPCTEGVGADTRRLLMATTGRKNNSLRWWRCGGGGGRGGVEAMQVVVVVDH